MDEYVDIEFRVILTLPDVAEDDAGLEREVKTALYRGVEDIDSEDAIFVEVQNG